MEERIIALIASECGVDPARVRSSSDLANDLGIAGDDGVELMNKYALEFGVDLTGFDPEAFFGPEAAFNPFAVLFPSWWRARRQKRVLTVSDLVELAKCRSWSSFSERGDRK